MPSTLSIALERRRQQRADPVYAEQQNSARRVRVSECHIKSPSPIIVRRVCQNGCASTGSLPPPHFD